MKTTILLLAILSSSAVLATGNHNKNYHNHASAVSGSNSEATVGDTNITITWADTLEQESIPTEYQQYAANLNETMYNGFAVSAALSGISLSCSHVKPDHKHECLKFSLGANDPLSGKESESLAGAIGYSFSWDENAVQVAAASSLNSDLQLTISYARQVNFFTD